MILILRATVPCLSRNQMPWYNTGEVKPGSHIAVIAGDCHRYMCRRLPLAICSQIHPFAGNHAGSQALIIESLLLLSVVFSREAEALQKYGVSSNRQFLLATHCGLILTYYTFVKLTSSKLKQRKICRFSNISAKHTTWLSIVTYRVVLDTVHQCFVSTWPFISISSCLAAATAILIFRNTRKMTRDR